LGLTMDHGSGDNGSGIGLIAAAAGGAAVLVAVGAIVSFRTLGCVCAFVCVCRCVRGEGGGCAVG
jgi:hypothetical protein